MSPSNHAKGHGIKLSFADVFKSSKTLRDEMAAAAYRKDLLEANNKRLAALEALITSSNNTPAQPPDSNAEAAKPAQPSDAKPSKETPKDDTVPRWTTDQDEELSKLKSENTSWRAISTALGRPVSELKNRWNFIRPAAPPNTPKEKPNKEESEEEKVSGAEGSGNKKSKRRVSFTEPLFTPGKADHSSKKVIYYTDDNFTLEEVILLNKLAEKYEQEKWLWVSSRFYDKTGKRLSPEEARKHIQLP